MITFKRHRLNFKMKPQCSFINTIKKQVYKIILEWMCSKLSKTLEKHWSNKKNWFDIEQKRKFSNVNITYFWFLYLGKFITKGNIFGSRIYRCKWREKYYNPLLSNISALPQKWNIDKKSAKCLPLGLEVMITNRCWS